MTLREKGMKIWETLRPEQKKKATIAGIVIAIVIFALIFYKTTHQQGVDQSKKVAEKKERSLLTRVPSKSLSITNRQNKWAICNPR